MTAGKATTMFGLPVHLASYGSTLLPGIFTAILCAYLERFFYRVIPGLFRSVFAPLCVFLIGFPIVVLALGPIGNIVGSWIVAGIIWLQAHVGGFAPGIIACSSAILGYDGCKYVACSSYDGIVLSYWV